MIKWCFTIMSAKILGFSLELLMLKQICFLQICNS